MKKVMSEDGSYITIYLSDEDGEPTLKAMQEVVGGYIEVVYAENGDQIILDEEGRLKGKPINEDASEHWLGDRWDNDTANIVGDAIVLSGKARLS
jgi:hypothetical protein